MVAIGTGIQMATNPQLQIAIKCGCGNIGDFLIADFDNTGVPQYVGGFCVSCAYAFAVHVGQCKTHAHNLGVRMVRRFYNHLYIGGLN